jgi:DNA repair ATPase RecN
VENLPDQRSKPKNTITRNANKLSTVETRLRHLLSQLRTYIEIIAVNTTNINTTKIKVEKLPDQRRKHKIKIAETTAIINR